MAALRFVPGRKASGAPRSGRRVCGAPGRLERETGFEPATPSLEGWCSSQLSYSRVGPASAPCRRLVGAGAEGAALRPPSRGVRRRRASRCRGMADLRPRPPWSAALLTPAGSPSGSPLPDGCAAVVPSASCSDARLVPVSLRLAESCRRILPPMSTQAIRPRSTSFASLVSRARPSRSCPALFRLSRRSLPALAPRSSVPLFVRPALRPAALEASPLYTARVACGLVERGGFEPP